MEEQSEFKHKLRTPEETEVAVMMKKQKVLAGVLATSPRDNITERYRRLDFYLQCGEETIYCEVWSDVADRIGEEAKSWVLGETNLALKGEFLGEQFSATKVLFSFVPPRGE